MQANLIPSLSAKPPSLQRPNRRLPHAAEPPKFGYAHVVMERFFKPITEDYFWGFLARDILGLWLPRIINSLNRGRIPYNPQTDPQYGKRGALEQWTHALNENIKGLNTPNGWEETAREVQSGPGWMVAHAALFGVCMAQSKGHRALMMSHNELKEFFGLLSTAVPKGMLETMHRLPAQQQREALLRAFLRKALQHHLKMGETISITPKDITHCQSRFATKQERIFLSWLRRNNAFQPNRNTVKNALERWINQYVRLFQKEKHPSVHLDKLIELENVWDELIDFFNTRARNTKAPLSINHIELPSVLPGQKIFHMSSDGFLKTLNKFSTAMYAITDELTPSQVLTSSRFQSILGQLRKQIVRKKVILSPAATILGGALAFYVAAISQSDKRKYPANRLIPLPEKQQVLAHHQNTEYQNYLAQSNAYRVRPHARQGGVA